MAFGFYSLLEAGLLIVNAIAVLNRERFLAKLGLDNTNNYGGFGDQPGVKAQLVNLVYAVQTVMRVPLIFINAFVIVVKLFLG